MYKITGQGNILERRAGQGRAGQGRGAVVTFVAHCFVEFFDSLMRLDADHTHNTHKYAHTSTHTSRKKEGIALEIEWKSELH
jgi:hypothetical protein